MAIAFIYNNQYNEKINSFYNNFLLQYFPVFLETNFLELYPYSAIDELYFLACGTTELHPPLFYKKSTMITVILSDPKPSFYLISSNVAGHISSKSLWLVK